MAEKLPQFTRQEIQVAERIKYPEDLFESRTEIMGVTIDSKTSKDLDDAIWLERTDKGVIAHVSIADVSALVQLNSVLDKAALNKGATIYRAQGNNPMIPRVLSEGSLSLLEGELRPTLTVSVELDENLEVVGEPLMRETFIRSLRKLSHEATNDAVKRREDPEEKILGECKDLADKLLQKRRTKGALAFYDLRKGLVSTEEGAIVKATNKNPTAQILVQEFMILANEAVAKYFAAQDIACLFRNHVAKGIAPSRDAILEQVYSGLNNPESFDLGSISEKMHLWMNRSKYGPILEGHFGLNLPAYTHFTSPIRRYADLVNHRILRATIRGEASPYTRAQLETIAGSINEKEDAEKDAKSAHFKSKAKAKSREDLTDDQVEQLSRLSSKEFSNLIKVAYTEGGYSDGFIKVLVNRIEAHQLTTRDYSFAMLLSQKEETIKNALLDLFGNKPSEAVAMLNTFFQMLQQEGIEGRFEEKQTQSGSRIARVLINRQGEDMSSKHYGTASSIKGARESAALSFIQGFLAGGLVKSNETSMAENSTRESNHPLTERLNEAPQLSANPIGELGEICQKRGTRMPEYSDKMTGPSHAPTVNCVCSVSIDGKNYTFEATSGSKKDAKKLAAQGVLNQFRTKGEVSSVEEVNVIDNSNPISAVNEYCQKNGLSAPSYEFQQTGPDHAPTMTCVCLITDLNNSEVIAQFTAGSKKDAKTGVAKEILKKL